MATSIDFNTQVLRHSSDQVLGYSDDFFYQHCTFRALSCINRAAKEGTFGKNRTADFRVPVQFIQHFSVSFIHLQSSEKKNCSMVELSPLFLNTISSVNGQIVPIFKMVRFFITIYIYHI